MNSRFEMTMTTCKIHKYEVPVLSKYYDKNGKKMCCTLGWSEKFEDRKYATIGRCESGDVTVSTVWLGMDHGWGKGKPIIFETMIFGGEHDQYQERYSTQKEAVAGHEKACELAFKQNSLTEGE